MNSTPPEASLNFCFTSLAVQPTYLPTKSPRPHSTNAPVLSTCSSSRILARSLAIVVLALPGFPAKTMCMELKPDCILKSFLICLSFCKATIRRIRTFGPARPTSFSISLRDLPAETRSFASASSVQSLTSA